jgi:acyl-CoA reductase-like NAD-dependent aldehyde dehydrogenase
MKNKTNITEAEFTEALLSAFSKSKAESAKKSADEAEKRWLALPEEERRKILGEVK